MAEALIPIGSISLFAVIGTSMDSPVLQDAGADGGCGGVGILAKGRVAVVDGVELRPMISGQNVGGRLRCARPWGRGARFRG
jgi:hypothetical protein